MAPLGAMVDNLKIACNMGYGIKELLGCFLTDAGGDTQLLKPVGRFVRDYLSNHPQRLLLQQQGTGTQTGNYGTCQ